MYQKALCPLSVRSRKTKDDSRKLVRIKSCFDTDLRNAYSTTKRVRPYNEGLGGDFFPVIQAVRPEGVSGVSRHRRFAVITRTSRQPGRFRRPVEDALDAPANIVAPIILPPANAQRSGRYVACATGEFYLE